VKHGDMLQVTKHSGDIMNIFFARCPEKKKNIAKWVEISRLSKLGL